MRETQDHERNVVLLQGALQCVAECCSDSCKRLLRETLCEPVFVKLTRSFTGVDASRRYRTSDVIKPTKAYVEIERERLFLLNNRTDV